MSAYTTASTHTQEQTRKHAYTGTNLPTGAGGRASELSADRTLAQSTRLHTTPPAYILALVLCVYARAYGEQERTDRRKRGRGREFVREGTKGGGKGRIGEIEREREEGREEGREGGREKAK